MALSSKDRQEIGLYRRTGEQDCANTIGLDDFDFDQPGATAEQIVDALELMSFDDWMEQFGDDVPEHIAKECYEAWEEGWKACAVRHVEAEIERRKQNHTLYFLMTGGVDWEGRHEGGNIIERFSDFEEAMVELAKMGDRREKATLFEGDAVHGPETMVAYIGLGFYPIGRAGYELDVKEWREKYREPVVKKPIKTNPIDDGEVFWLVIGDASPIDVRKKIASGELEVVEKFDYFEDALNELIKLPPAMRARILVGNAKSPSENVVAYRSTVDGRIFPAFSYVYQDQVHAWKEKNGIDQPPVIARSRPPWSNAVKKNPTEDTKRAAIGKYKEFWRQEPTKVGEFPASFKIPDRVHKLGRAVNVLYESKKTDPETLKKPGKPLAYIHEHDAGVHIHDLQGEKDTEVPDFIKHAQALVCLGQCLGFAWWDEEGDEHEAEGSDPLPDLWCTVDGRALLVIQSRRTVLQIVWGGGLGVEARGIVG